MNILKCNVRARDTKNLIVRMEGIIYFYNRIFFSFSFLRAAQMKEFWKHLAWPDLIQSYNFVLKLLDVMTCCHISCDPLRRYYRIVFIFVFAGNVRGGLVLRSTGPPEIEGFRILRRRVGI